MFAHYEQCNSSTSSTYSLDKIKFRSFPADNGSYSYNFLIDKKLKNLTENVVIIFTENTCSTKDYFQNDIDKFSNLYSFSKNLIKEQTSVPPEFEEIFKENFWDLLA